MAEARDAGGGMELGPPWPGGWVMETGNKKKKKKKNTLTLYSIRQAQSLAQLGTTRRNERKGAKKQRRWNLQMQAGTGSDWAGATLVAITTRQRVPLSEAIPPSPTSDHSNSSLLSPWPGPLQPACRSLFFHLQPRSAHHRSKKKTPRAHEVLSTPGCPIALPAPLFLSLLGQPQTSSPATKGSRDARCKGKCNPSQAKDVSRSATAPGERDEENLREVEGPAISACLHSRHLFLSRPTWLQSSEVLQQGTARPRSLAAPSLAGWLADICAAAFLPTAAAMVTS
ncbi:hypothetical protein MAPG_07850 [Magnaporthiopsis poae ATCC 64411]|uniref:Uncharacterized protein n=1 Tax=Magnaporthiopsis poae (strain ATCC 64411 / 73-15) TaxID=644358 RepID=A0A0C4E5S6_MAGP6|nr:hypothetical protein MAPG_07850 [Magnaporthiopsis poae ATCC 64411]